MKAIGQQMMWLWGTGCFLCVTVAGAEVDAAAQAQGRALGERWFHQLSSRLVAKPQPVIHLPNEAGRVPDFRFPMLTTPPPTGPLSFVWALGTGFAAPSNPGDFSTWIQHSASPIQKQRYQQIMKDLRAYMAGRGYDPQQSAVLANQLFAEKFTLYFPLIEHGQPNLQALAGHSVNPYSRNSVRNTATDYYNLGLMCQKMGNDTEAAKHFTKAARTQYPQAQASLGYLHETGKGVERDLKKALELYHAAAKQGHSVAQYNLGRIYQHGLAHGLQKVPQDLRLAEQFLQRAAAQGIVAAYHQLGVLYYSLGLRIDPASLTPEQFAQWDKNQDKLVSQDENRLLQDAHDHFLMAANQDHGPAQHSLGVMYYRGEGVPKSDLTAANWLEKAKKHKLPDSLYNLAQMYERGEGVRLNLTRAFILYREAARLGHAPAQYNFGLFYYQGRKAGLQLSVEVPEHFVTTYPPETLPSELVKLDVENNAYLADALASYQTLPGTKNQRLELLLPGNDATDAQRGLDQLFKLAQVTQPMDSHVEQLGGDDPVKAYAWWTLSAARGQKAAQKNRDELGRTLSTEQLQQAAALAKAENANILAPKPPNPLVQAKSKLPFQAADWSTGFFVSEDGYVVTGKHLLHSGNQFQVVTENGTFPAKVINLPGDLDQYLLLKVQGDYQFTPLRLNASHAVRAQDPVQVLGYQMPHVNQGTLPNAAQASTQINRVLGAQADPRFFTLQKPVLGDQVLYKFSKHLDKLQTPVATLANPGKANNRTVLSLQSDSLKLLKGLLRAWHPLLGNADISLGYQLTAPLGYDPVDHKWIKNPKPSSRALPHATGQWVVLDGRKIQTAPPLDSVLEGQLLVRISAFPGMIKDGEQYLRLFQLAEAKLTAKGTGIRQPSALETRLMDAEFSVIQRTPGFRGTALLNRQGQAIGLFFPSFHGRSPDVFRNFSSYHQYLLKSDHLMAFLNRLPAVKYSTLEPELPKVASSEPIQLDRKAYLLAKAKASMVLVQVAGGSANQGGAKP